MPAFPTHVQYSCNPVYDIFNVIDEAFLTPKLAASFE